MENSIGVLRIHAVRIVFDQVMYFTLYRLTSMLL